MSSSKFSVVFQHGINLLESIRKADGTVYIECCEDMYVAFREHFFRKMDMVPNEIDTILKKKKPDGRSSFRFLVLIYSIDVKIIFYETEATLTLPEFDSTLAGEGLKMKVMEQIGDVNDGDEIKIEEGIKIVKNFCLTIEKIKKNA